MQVQGPRFRFIPELGVSGGNVAGREQNQVLRERFPMKETIERNFLRFGRNLMVPLVVYVTYMLVTAPIYYVLGIIRYGNSITDFWVLKYTLLNIPYDLFFVAAPVAVLLGFYEIFRLIAITFYKVYKLSTR